MNKACYFTASELAERGIGNLPDELCSAKHMIYSSPATLDYNSPGAKGFGVKRAGLVIPESVMLLVAPGCCGRNTALLNSLGYSERFFYLLLDDTDIVTGRYLNKIPKACAEIAEEMNPKPSAIVICVTCADALLGTDMDRVCRSCEEASGIPSVPAYMYALTREKRLPPMALVRKSVYSLLKPQKRKSNECALLGYFSALNDTCELYPLLRSAGIREIHEIGRCKTFAEYSEISRSNFSIVLNAEARYAAQDMQKALGIPFIELTRLYRIDKIRTQYRLLGQAIGADLDDAPYYADAKKKTEEFRLKYGSLRFAVGECLNADSFELALSLLEYGHRVTEIYGTIGERNFVFLKKIAEHSPETRIYSNLDPSMLCYVREPETDAVIGNDAMYYHPDLPGIGFQEEAQPFGYQGVCALFSQLDAALEANKRQEVQE
ncbi:MAG: oxidoreductase [Oscillospiraceae bacterium]|nr:oxidoreductase [Oscillospiraceae bacterium]